MAKASPDIIKRLETLLNEAAGGLGKVVAKKMFGCHGLFANESIFALVWKEGRIGVRLPDAPTFAALMSLKGAAPWKAGPMTMSHWVLVPAHMHADDGSLEALSSWVVKAHGLAMSLPKEKKAAGKAATKSGTSHRIVIKTSSKAKPKTKTKKKSPAKKIAKPAKKKTARQKGTVKKSKSAKK